MEPTGFAKLAPAPLLDDLIGGRWLPIVGAGMSKNANVPSGHKPNDWQELGRTIARDTVAVGSDAPLEILSAYEHSYGRVALINRLAALLRVQDATPGNAQLAFARLGFARVVTTNFDLLLEKAYDAVERPCHPLVEEVQLSHGNLHTGPSLLKFHGDFHHPHRMIVTEDDYDGFNHRWPLLVTHLAALLIDHSGILIGYSLDDPDLRQILALLRDRLGRMMRPLWAIQVNAPGHVVSRYERRGVRVLNLIPEGTASYGETLAKFFGDLRAYWERTLIERSQSTNERTLADLRLPPESSKACYFAVPMELVSWYRDTLAPVVEEIGLVPVFARDVVAPGDSLAAKIEALIGRARVVVADESSEWSRHEAALARLRIGPTNVLVFTDGAHPVSDATAVGMLPTPADLSSPDEFVQAFRTWLIETVGAPQQRGQGEARRLLRVGEARAALIAAISQLEWELDRALDLQGPGRRPAGLSQLLRLAVNKGLIPTELWEPLSRASTLRNQALHTGQGVLPQEAEDAIVAVEAVIDQLPTIR